MDSPCHQVGTETRGTPLGGAWLGAGIGGGVSGCSRVAVRLLACLTESQQKAGNRVRWLGLRPAVGVVRWVLGQAAGQG